ncbi:hypothetical protein BO82DRAFT_408390 [Aspergillus uvarum CBS 121591]|uniref:Uncharacterized protein n=1 Tax=Aspergillus uvarum CBS 121591 TaxID=1448315 RepID=A0A319DGG3_9EURO|nr:hypothetical protein BO82DRAFT_408390 [Aspergillus uvarum CBS 121591]PYH87218.1 hypothetical protein BO82DRAFT_408390 [Aspergillus uvarum CBS 121591]
MDGFRGLPHELLAIIVRNTADWISLESSILASPPVTAPFEPGESPDAPAESDAIYLVKEVLQANPVMNSGLDHYFYMCAALRRRSVNDRSLADFLARDFSLETTRTTMTRASLREMVGVAANIQRLACICLTSFLTRLRAILPEYLNKVGLYAWFPDSNAKASVTMPNYTTRLSSRRRQWRPAILPWGASGAAQAPLR